MPAMPEVLPPPTPGFAGARQLNEFYTRSGLELPELRPLKAKAMPEPYQTLLAHSHDMTSTLENYFQQRVWVRVLSRLREGNYYFREVALVEAQNQQPVEYGVIKIDLALFGASARQAILEEHLPLGRILQDDAIAHTSWPQAFFSVEPVPRLQEVLEFNGAQTLYGRRNLLLDGHRQLLADVVEILPPLDGNTQT